MQRVTDAIGIAAALPLEYSRLNIDRATIARAGKIKRRWRYFCALTLVHNRTSRWRYATSLLVFDVVVQLVLTWRSEARLLQTKLISCTAVGARRIEEDARQRIGL